MEIIAEKGYKDDVIKALSDSAQKKYWAMTDVFTFDPKNPEGKSGRVEMRGQKCLCQADNQVNQWGSEGRYVYAVNRDQTKALYIGYTPEHRKDFGRKKYEELKAIARSKTEEDFIGKDSLQEDYEIEKVRKIAKEEAKTAGLLKPRKETIVDKYKKLYNDYKELYPDKVNEKFRECLENRAQPLSRKDRSRITMLPHDDPVRVIALDVSDKKKQEQKDKEQAEKNGQQEATKTPEEKTEGVSLQQAVQQAEPKKQQALDISQKMADHKQAVETKKTNREKLNDAMIAAKTGKTEETKTAGQESKNVAGPSIPPGLPINGDRGR